VLVALGRDLAQDFREALQEGDDGVGVGVDASPMAIHCLGTRSVAA
jgi:hypothetical protein